MHAIAGTVQNDVAGSQSKPIKYVRHSTDWE